MKNISKWVIIILLFNLFFFPLPSTKANVSIDGNIADGEYAQNKVFQDGDYILYWKIDGEMISIAMKAKTIGWVSVGIDPESKMKNADIYIGWVTNAGITELFDTFCSVEMGPHPPDVDQEGTNDIMSFAGKDDGTYTTIEFTRKLDTQDLKDKVIPKLGKLNIMVAYGATDEFKPRHIFRTTNTIDIDPVKEKFIEINAMQAKELIDKSKNLQVLDVSPYWRMGHIPGAINIESNDLLANLDKLDRKKATLVYCHGDAPAIFGANLLIANGFKPVFRLLGNYKAWVDAGYPVEKSLEKIVIRFKIGSLVYSVGPASKTMDSAPLVLDGRTLIPIRYLAEAIGATITWDAKTQKVTIQLGATKIELTIGKNTAEINGISAKIDPDNPKVKPIVIPPGRTMLPLRFVAEQLNCTVAWNPENREITITYPK